MNSDKESSDHKQQQEQSSNVNSKPELTAEWTVHAQLTISRPDDSTKECETDDRQNPVRVVYKWSSDNLKSTGKDQSGTFTETTESSPKGHHDSFHSTAGGKLPSDSGLSSSNASRKQPPYGGSRCKSTCSIVLSAVADFFPKTTEIHEEPDPYFFNTTTNYNLSPDQADNDANASQSFGPTKILALRDAFSQTSDTETKRSTTLLYPSPRSSCDPKDEKKRMLYDYRRLTESMLPPPVDEGTSYLPSYGKNISQSPHFSSQSNLEQQRRGSSQKSDTKKQPPRTVHIDVYCTGSDAEDDDEDEDDDDDEDESSQTSSNNPNEIESNSTPQTVLDTEQMLLRHQRAGKSDIPRRLMTQQQQQQQQNPTHVRPDETLSHLGHALTESNTADEISESKQILFKKHIGDQRSKFNFRNRNFRRDPSDDALSSNYPNSSRSTMRDMTCSSISSVAASCSAINENLESSWKETEPEMTVTSLTKSDSFEYDNSIDRFRIQKMERLWCHPGDDPNGTTYKLSNQQKRIQDFLQGYRPPRRTYHDTLPSEYDNLSETDHSYRQTIPERDETMEQVEPAVIHSHRLTLDRMYAQAQSKSPERHSRVMFTADYNKSGSEASTLLSNLSGYTSEYLLKARKFGAVVTALRKPGHHVGPAKNPECQCEHCRRWMAERNQGRGRALSMDDAPLTRAGFWLKRATPNL